MSIQVSFGGHTTTSGHTQGAIYVDGIDLPQGRTAANGTHPIVITSVAVYAAGYGGSAAISIRLGGWLGDVNVTAGSSASLTAFQSDDTLRVSDGDTVRLTLNSNSSYYFGRGGSGTSHGDYGDFAGSLGGAFRYIQVPTAPRTPAAVASSSTSGQIDVSWTAPSDNGGAVITGYTIYDDVTDTSLADVSAATLSWSHTGLTPGTSHGYYVRAKNSVTEDSNTHSFASASVYATVTGSPGAPTGLTATPSTTTVGRINLAWVAPTLVGTGGITSYDVYANGVLVASVPGTSVTKSVNGLVGNTSYSFLVYARNAFTDSTGTTGPPSNTAVATAPGVPSAPLSLTATPDSGTPGRVVLAWSAPTETAGGITGYTVFDSDGSLRATLGNVLTDNVDGLTSGLTYSFYVEARNALSDSSGVLSAPSNTATATPTGAPLAVSGVSVVSSPVVAGRLVVSWLTAATATLYNVYTGAGVLLGTTGGLSFTADGLIPGASYSYNVAARNPYTDSTGSTGPMSATASGTPGGTSVQSVPSGVSVTDITNTALNGTFVITALSSNSFSYPAVATNVTTTASGGSATDVTNTAFAGTYSIASVPTPTTLTYAKTGANLSTSAVSNGTINDLTNPIFNGTFTVSAVDAPNSKVFYTLTGTPADVASGATAGTVSNTTNLIFNGTSIPITATPTTKTLQYAKTHADVVESASTGTVVDRTNIDVFNGAHIITAVPSYNTLTYTKTASNVTATAVPTSGADATIAPTASKALLTVKYRSGWAG